MKNFEPFISHIFKTLVMKLLNFMHVSYSKNHAIADFRYETKF